MIFENTELAPKLKQVITNTLEDWAMMLVENSGDESFCENMISGGYFTTINLKGANVGRIEILATKEFAKMLYQNLVGEMDEEAEDYQLMDCLKEMANVTAGKFISEVFGDSVVYDLTDLSCDHVKDIDIEVFNKNETKFFFLGDDFPIGFSLKI